MSAPVESRTWLLSGYRQELAESGDVEALCGIVDVIEPQDQERVQSALSSGSSEAS